MAPLPVRILGNRVRTVDTQMKKPLASSPRFAHASECNSPANLLHARYIAWSGLLLIAVLQTTANNSMWEVGGQPIENA